MENVFYRNPNLTRVGSLAAIFVNIASIMILRLCFFPVTFILLSFSHIIIKIISCIEGNDFRMFQARYENFAFIWWHHTSTVSGPLSLHNLQVKYWRCPLSLSPDWRKMPHILGSWRTRRPLLRISLKTTLGSANIKLVATMFKTKLIFLLSFQFGCKIRGKFLLYFHICASRNYLVRCRLYGDYFYPSTTF